jgi:hypothetical protein
MSAKALGACRFELAAQRTVATNYQAGGDPATEIRFREDLWREYRLEASNAGFSAARATEYASALSPEMGLIAGVCKMAPAGRGWFYHSRIRVVGRTVASGLITLKRWEESKTMGRTAGSGVPIFAPSFRPWNVKGKS